jgi:hypothetical protein
MKTFRRTLETMVVLAALAAVPTPVAANRCSEVYLACFNAGFVKVASFDDLARLKKECLGRELDCITREILAF